MDLIHFVCLTCGNEFDTGAEPAPCPECGSSNTYLIKPCRTENIPIYSGPGDCQDGDSRWEQVRRFPQCSVFFVSRPEAPGLYVVEDGSGNITAVSLMDNVV